MLVSVDGGVTFSSAAVLSFNSTNWNQNQTVLVRAANDDTLEGHRTVAISHSVLVTSQDPLQRDQVRFDEAAVSNILTQVIDDDVGSLVIEPSGFDTAVLEGAVALGGVEDTYTVRLSVAPTSNVTVTVGSLELGREFNLFDANGVAITQLTFTPVNWDIPQFVRVRAVDDALLENTELIRLTHTFSSPDPVYSTSVPELHDVKVYDNDSAQVIVRETDGSTRVVRGGAGDEYTIRLSRDPEVAIDVQIFQGPETLLVPDPRILLGSDGVPFIRFDSSNWFQEVLVRVEANPSFVPTPGASSTLVEPLRPHIAAQIRGPLAIEGGIAEGKDRSLRMAVVLPNEATTAPKNVGINVDESARADRLNVFDDTSVADDQGVLSTTSVWPNQIAVLGEVASGRLPMNLSD